ncbi:MULTISPECIES: Maf-like protein [Alphaproteobacteria]|uniref:Nucleoside triphosphate pyrophosphatase n=2 Tax=Alphaproteobacteria TaxID=28211 RepID=A0A512HMC7_9HYPH|nr:MULTISPECIES: Maf-like protein [Alphaproteobacteria]GEO86593.1 Maf-like protein [Ciceribacter naphthalenivorans]GLR20835.1 Maf-like protein [Ciceribacter naphthalenivorans]GLT03691.1 Maf-like protein [Sphingomonas psychrolutea]
MAETLVLASASQSRRTLMENAGLAFAAVAAAIDERAVERSIEHRSLGPAELAVELALQKALEVSDRFPGALVVGCDQTMSLGQEVFHKPSDRVEARTNLQALRGKTHRLNSGVVLVRDGAEIWRHVSIADLTMRDFSEDFLDDYLERCGEAVMRSVGCYQLEGIGIQLFTTILGDYFTILGLPLLPLLERLRALGEIDV